MERNDKERYKGTKEKEEEKKGWGEEGKREISFILTSEIVPNRLCSFEVPIPLPSVKTNLFFVYPRSQ